MKSKQAEVREAKTLYEGYPACEEQRKVWNARRVLFQSHSTSPAPLTHIFTQLFIQQILIQCILCFKNGPWSKVQINSAGSPLSIIPKTSLVAVNRSTCWGFLGSFHKSSIFHDWSQSDLGPVPVPGQRFSSCRMGLLPEIR